MTSPQKTIEDNAVGMIWGKTYSKQRRNSIALTVAKVGCPYTDKTKTLISFD